MPHCNRQDRSLPDDRDCGKPERLEKVRSGAACETKHETLGTAMIVQRSVVIMSIAALLGLPLPAEGQAPPESLLRVGARVRYRVPDGSRPYTGLVQQVDTGGFAVRPDDTELLVRLGLDTLRSLAVFQRVRSHADGARRGAATGLTFGLLAGAAATTLVWLSSADERCSDCWVSATGVTVVLSAFGTVGLTLLGGVFGASAPGEIWNDIPVGAARRRR